MGGKQTLGHEPAKNNLPPQPFATHAFGMELVAGKVG